MRKMYQMMKADEQRVAEKIVESGRGVKELEKISGLSVNTLLKIRFGDEVRITTMQKFCQALGATFDDLGVEAVWCGNGKMK